VFANNEPTVVSPWGLAADDPSLLSRSPFAENGLPLASRRKPRSTLSRAVMAAGLVLVAGAALFVLRGGGRPTGGLAGAPSSPAAPSPATSAPAALPAAVPVRRAPEGSRETTAAMGGPETSTTEATASVRAAAAGEPAPSGRSLARGRARTATPAKAAGPKESDRPAGPTVAADCRLTVGSYPWSDLWIDGANTGQQTPVVGLPVTCGPHRLEFKRRDLKVDQEERVTLSEGREFKREYELQGAALDE
jgi:hypothetical protein